MAISQKGKISPAYMTGLIIVPFIGWTSGTIVGAFASQILPEIISDVMGIMLYGMFIAVFVPASKKSKNVLLAVLISAGASIIFKYLLTFVSGGFSIILSAIIASVVCALIFPVKEEKE